MSKVGTCSTNEHLYHMKGKRQQKHAIVVLPAVSFLAKDVIKRNRVSEDETSHTQTSCFILYELYA